MERLPHSRHHRAVAVVFLGAGGNLGDVSRTFELARAALVARGVHVLRRAGLYRTRALGPPQPDYLNTVFEAETELEPEPLLQVLKAIETELGRTPSERWGPRVIDLDLLLHDQRIVELPHLVVPHRELTRRRFVLAPLADLAPSRIIPGTGETVRTLLERLPDDPSDVVLISPPP